MGDSTIQDGSTLSPPLTLYYFISGVVWIPYCLLLIYAFYESKSKKLYPQYVIVMFFVIGACTRCFWFFAYPYDYYNKQGIEELSRVAMISQFSAVSLLLFLWSRSLNLSNSLADSNAKRSTSMTDTMTASKQSTLSIEDGSAASPPARVTNAPGNRSTVGMRGRYSVQDMELQNYRRNVWIVVNLIVWIGSLLAGGFWTTKVSYDLHCIVISFLCFITSILISVIGYKNFIRVRDDLAPVFSLPHSNESRKSMKSNSGEVIKVKFWEFIIGNNNSRSHTLRLQTEALRTVLRVSFVVSTLYLLQGFAFIYQLQVVNEGTKLRNWNFEYSQYIIILLVYQLPGFFPALVITHSLSAPNSVFRRKIFMSVENICNLLSGDAVIQDHSICTQLYASIRKRCKCCCCCKNAVPASSNPSISNSRGSVTPTETSRETVTRRSMNRMVSMSDDILDEELQYPALAMELAHSNNPLHDDGEEEGEDTTAAATNNHHNGEEEQN